MKSAEAQPSTATLYALLAAMVTAWSLNYIFAKLAVREIPPVLAVCWRTVFSALIMGAVYLWRRRDAHARWSRSDLPGLLAIGILGVVGNQLLFVMALGRTSVAHGAIIAGTSPIMVLIGATALRMEKMTRRKLVGVLLAAAGVAALELGRSSGTGHPTLAGDLTMLSSTTVFAAFTVLGKRVMERTGTIAVNTVAYLAGGILLLPYAAWSTTHTNVMHASATAWLSVLYMALFSGVIGYLIYSYALEHMPASRVSTVSYLQPVGATLFAIPMLGETPGSGFLAGAALVITGVYLTERG